MKTIFTNLRKFLLRCHDEGLPGLRPQGGRFWLLTVRGGGPVRAQVLEGFKATRRKVISRIWGLMFNVPVSNYCVLGVPLNPLSLGRPLEVSNTFWRAWTRTQLLSLRTVSKLTLQGFGLSFSGEAKDELSSSKSFFKKHFLLRAKRTL